MKRRRTTAARFWAAYQVGTSLARVLAPFVSGSIFQRFGAERAVPAGRHW
jgi:hypothetical protein